MRFLRVACALPMACLAFVLGAALIALAPGTAWAESEPPALEVSDEMLPDYEGASPASTMGSGKLAGATETVDGNGVVHGTTPDGVSYVLYGRGQTGADRGALDAARDLGTPLTGWCPRGGRHRCGSC